MIAYRLNFIQNSWTNGLLLDLYSSIKKSYNFRNVHGARSSYLYVKNNFCFMSYKYL